MAFWKNRITRFQWMDEINWNQKNNYKREFCCIAMQNLNSWNMKSGAQNLCFYFIQSVLPKHICKCTSGEHMRRFPFYKKVAHGYLRVIVLSNILLKKNSTFCVFNFLNLYFENGVSTFYIQILLRNFSKYLF